MTAPDVLVCSGAARLIVRHADGADLDAREQRALRNHLATCSVCLALLDEQRTVAALLRARPPNHVSTSFRSQLAARLQQASGWMGIADWRIWTIRLTPVAAALALVALLTARSTISPASVTLEEWTRGTTDSSPASSWLWQRNVKPESLVELMLTGRTPSNADSGDVR